MANPEKLLLESRHALGDAVVFTGLIRDIHRCYPGKYITQVITASYDAVWSHNPNIPEFSAQGFRKIRIHYADEFNAALHRRQHFLQGYINYFNNVTGLNVVLTDLKPDLHLSEAEKAEVPHGIANPYWVLVAGGKSDITTKWWYAQDYQQVVNQLAHDVQFVRVGRSSHYHPPIENVTDLVGKTSARELIRLIYHSEGVVCPVTGAMHIAAAFDKPAVVIAGGREPWWWESYYNHTFLHTIGSLPCCEEFACMCQFTTARRKGKMCLAPVELDEDTATGKVAIAKCMHTIRPHHVVEAVRQHLVDPVPSVKFLDPVRIEGPVEEKRPLGAKATVCVAFYGGVPGNETYDDKQGVSHKYTDLHDRFLTGLVENTDMGRIQLRVALNEVAEETVTKLDVLRSAGHDIITYSPNENRYKYPRLREMFYDDENPILTKWVIVLDDDVDFRFGPWLDRLDEHMKVGLAAGAKCFGEHYIFHLRPTQLAWHMSRPWWQDRTPKMVKRRFARVDFCCGGIWAMTLADLEELDWPDPEIKHNHGDVALGSAMYQRGWQIWNCPEVIDCHNSPTRGYFEQPPELKLTTFVERDSTPVT